MCRNPANLRYRWEMNRASRNNAQTGTCGAVSGPNAHPSSNALRAGTYVVAVLLLGLLCGCESQSDNGMANSYYLNPHKDLRRLGRVALVELDNLSGYPEISANMTDALFLAVQKKQVFGLTVIRQQDPDWSRLQGNLDSVQALQQLPTLRADFKCNGLLVGTITQYQPYPHLVIGLRLKLLDLTDGQLLWGLEQVWDSGDKSVQKRIETYFSKEQRSGVAPVREELVAVSPLNFAKFVAYEVAQTLERQRKR